MNAGLIDKVLTRDVRARMSAPAAEGTCLPNACYTSDDWLALERERVAPRRER